MGLADEGLEDILSAFHSQCFQAGETIIQVGDSGDDLFLVTAGKVRIWSGSGPGIAERTLSVLGPGDHFGEAAALSGGKRSATVTAVTFVEALVLPGDHYRRLLKTYPQLLENISRSLTRRLSQMNEATRDNAKPKRRVHSLAILIDHPTGWALSQAMLGPLRQNDQAVQPVLVCDSPPPISAEEMDRDMLVVEPHELPLTIANRSRGDCIAVAIACVPKRWMLLSINATGSLWPWIVSRDWQAKGQKF